MTRFDFAAVLVLMVTLVSTPLLADHHKEGEYTKLFDGKTLGDWDGDPRFWRVENGELIGETTADNKAERNTFLIYRGGEYGDFDLRFSYRVKNYNSGIQYRSEDKGDWNVTGYQADFEDRWHNVDNRRADRFSGMFFDEQGRMFLGQRGEAVIVHSNPEDSEKPRIEKIGSLGDPAE